MHPRAALARIGHWLWRPILRRRLDRLVIERVEGTDILVLPQVFNPSVFRSGSLLARAITALPAPGDGARALDLGCGSGVGAVFAARLGYRVVAVDVNPEALRCARLNAVLHGLDDRIEVRSSDLFEAVSGERFQLVLFNPPFFRGRPEGPLDAAWRSENAVLGFATELEEHLSANGSALLVLSSHGDPDTPPATAAAHGLERRVACQRRYATETLTVWELRRRAGER